MNQQTSGGAWNLLGTYTFGSGTGGNITLTDQANGYVIADAIRLVPVQGQAQPAIYYIVPDHLNTPRLIADQAGNTVWRNDNTEPFGDSVPNGDPDGDGVAFDFPLRFPGQYFDRETGLHYNYYRDYDPSLGIYKQSDLIGLRGGINTYAYGGATPLTSNDPFGLCKVEVRFKPIPLVGSLGIYHAYIVTTDPSGAQNYYRGGPGGPWTISSWPVWGTIKTNSGAYGPNTPDWDPGTPPTVVVLDNSEPCNCYNANFSDTLSRVSAAGIPYIPLWQNSNSVAATVLSNAGLSPGSSPVAAPGMGNDLTRHIRK